MPRRSSNDKRSKHPYLLPECFLAITIERLANPYISKEYRERLERLKAECEYEMSQKIDLTIWQIPK